MEPESEESLVAQIAALEERLAKVRQREHAPVETVAEATHAVCCRLSHVDQCGWEYECWDRPGPTRKRYLEKAKIMLTFAEAPALLAILDAIRFAPRRG